MRTKQTLGTRDITFMGLCIAILTICSWITVPTTVPFTLQTFGIFLILILLGGMRGTIVIVAYLILGFVGIPVFAGMNGGMGVLLGPTGGYLIGFLFTGLIYWGMEALMRQNRIIKTLALILGLAGCYAFGTIWFVIVYSKNVKEIGILSAIMICVVPFLVFDGIKLIIAILLGEKIRRLISA